MLRKLIAPGLGLALSMVLIGALACGGGDSDDEATDDSDVAAGTSDEPSDSSSGIEISPALGGNPTAEPSERSRTEGDKYGGTLLLLGGDPPTLDPALVSDTSSARIVLELFSGLVRLDQNLKIVPDLAETWEMSDDFTVYTFTLRSDARFSDGSPVLASDFKYAMERAAHPDTESTVAELYLGDIVGIQEIIDGDGSVTTASGIEVLDDQTLRFTIDAPKPYFLAKLTYPTAFALRQSNVESGGSLWTDNPVGSGPFILEKYDIGVQMILARNENYYDRPAYLDRVQINLAGGGAMQQYETDEIDITGVGLSDLDRVQDPNDALNRDLVSVPPGFTTSYLGFNVEEPPLNDLKFRQALAHAIDKDEIAEAVFSGLVLPARGVLPPQFPGFNADLQPLEFDVAKAQQLLAESSYPSLSDRDKRIEITTQGTGASPSLSIVAMADMWSRHLGVEVEIQLVEFATYLQDLHRNRLQAYFAGWEADYPDPQDWIDILFHSESPRNDGNYSNPEVDRLVEKARTEQDVIRRTELYQQAEQMIVNDVAWIPVWWDTQGLALIKERVQDYNFQPMTIEIFKDVWIQE
ncbi:MAG: peptide ABC transporter substrate-binding protein [Dehalococcoidia bacterium]|jgi:oligopeptide transport system substrate-binding protein|nr:peptide ABC transporter substrate-binding protein [Dehalococcoidia bacterium]